MTVLAVMQPGYLPWLGFFDLIRRSDVFVLYDDVQFDRNGWLNRNRVKSASGPVWLTVPILLSGRWPLAVNEAEINKRRPWARKHVQTLRQLHAKAPHAGDYLPDMEVALNRPWERLVDLNRALIELMCGWLGLRRPDHLASDLGIEGERNQRLLNLCGHFGATRYLSADGASAYLDVDLFESSGIEVEWQRYPHPHYPQLHGAFLSHLSALDLLFNAGPKAGAILGQGTPSNLAETRPND